MRVCRAVGPDSPARNPKETHIASARGAQRDLQQAGQYGVAARMGEAVDEHLDELTDANRGTWKPKHA
ncbi:hypothetical protein [Streptomyces sp. NPDC088812]|uniref:hypothetical protein n=1 Tax=Streptomyces sp. NPDC088812 TaxID=3365905 RepID=UPI0038309D0B